MILSVGKRSNGKWFAQLASRGKTEWAEADNITVAILKVLKGVDGFSLIDAKAWIQKEGK